MIPSVATRTSVSSAELAAERTRRGYPPYRERAAPDDKLCAGGCGGVVHTRGVRCPICAHGIRMRRANKYARARYRAMLERGS